MLNYTDITQNTYIQSWTVSVMLISVLNIKLTCEWHKATKLNYKNIALLSYLSLGFQVIYTGRSCRYLAKVTALTMLASGV